MRISIRLLACLLIATTISACTTTRTVSVRATAPTLPEPVYDRVPITVAVWYAPELANHRATGTRTRTKPNGDQIVTHYDVQCGDANLIIIRQMIDAAFQTVKPLAAEPSGALKDPTVDLIVIPKIERVQYGAGADVRYSIALFRRDGEHLTNVFVVGTASESVVEERWLEVAMRDAAAQILVRLSRSEKFENWLGEWRRATASERGIRS